MFVPRVVATGLTREGGRSRQPRSGCDVADVAGIANTVLAQLTGRPLAAAGQIAYLIGKKTPLVFD